MMRRSVRALLLLLCAVLLPGSAFAQAGKWPERPIKVVIPFAPGGPNDMIARVWTDRLGQAFGQPFIIDNRGGATGQIGTEVVVRAPADGYTLLFASTSVLASSLVVRKTPVDPVRDLTAIARAGDLASAFAVHPSIPVKDMAEFKDYVRKNPGKLAYGTTGIGSLHHLLLEAIRLHSGLDMLHVPYRGAAEALTDLYAGVVQVGYDSTFMGQPAGRLTYIGVLLDQRLPNRPELPTLLESGLMPTSLNPWYGFYGPAKMPRAIVDAINAKVAEIGALPETKKTLLERAAILQLMTPDEMAKALSDQVTLNRQLVEKAGITVD